jgi:PIN domain nuclease of toxin-antitoxin system
LTVLDAQAVVSLLLGEPAAEDVAALIGRPDTPTCIGAVNLAEVLDVLVRLRRHSPDEVLERLEWLAVGGLEVVAIDEDLGLAAGRLRANHYDRTWWPVSLADCFALALAAARRESLATADGPLAAAAAEERVKVIGLADSEGRRPT